MTPHNTTFEIYKSQKISPLILVQISNYTKFVNFCYDINVILPNSVKYITNNNMFKTNIYPNSIIVKEDTYNNKYDTSKFIKLFVYESKYILNVLNVHSLTLCEFKNTQFFSAFNTIKKLHIDLHKSSDINLSKIITNGIHEINLKKCLKIKHMQKLRNVYALNILWCKEITNKIIISNVHTFKFEQDNFVEVMCNAYKMCIHYIDFIDNNYSDDNNYCYRHSNYACILHIQYFNLKHPKHICYTKILILDECSYLNIRQLVNVSNLTINECNVNNILNTMCFNKIHTLFLSNVEINNNNSYNYNNKIYSVPKLNNVHILTLNYVIWVKKILIMSMLHNIYKLHINTTNCYITKEMLITKAKLNTICDLKINHDE